MAQSFWKSIKLTQSEIRKFSELIFVQNNLHKREPSMYADRHKL